MCVRGAFGFVLALKQPSVLWSSVTWCVNSQSRALPGLLAVPRSCVSWGSVSPSDWSSFLSKGIRIDCGFYWCFGLCFKCWLSKCHYCNFQQPWLNFFTSLATTAFHLILLWLICKDGYLHLWVQFPFLLFSALKVYCFNQSIYHSVGYRKHTILWKYDNGNTKVMKFIIIRFYSVVTWTNGAWIFVAYKVFRYFFSESFGYLKYEPLSFCIKFFAR